MKEYFVSYLCKFLMISLFTFISSASYGQKISPGFMSFEDSYRRRQLIGSYDSTVSFNLRPIITVDSINKNLSFSKLTSIDFSLLPIYFRNEFNSHHPYVSNNSSLLPAKGYQSLLSIGFFAKWKFINIQFYPELTFASNSKYKGFDKDHYDVTWKNRYIYWNFSDNPERIGESNMWRFLPGQSFIKLDFNNYSFGLSTQNLWWGPGKNNSLLMTNNSEGFLHLTIHTQRPIQTKIGSFEGQLISGLLKSSGSYPPDTLRMFRKSPLFVRKVDDNRYLSGITFSYQPKWIQGFFIGASSIIQQYIKVVRNENNYMPVIASIFKQDKINNAALSPDQYNALFARWIWKEGNAEVYFEYGRNKKSYPFRKLLLSPESNRAFVFGFSKLIELNKNNNYLETNFEMTHLAQKVNYIVRNNESWYIDSNIRHGYTNKGKWIGAGIGPGSNIQTLEISWVNANYNKIGISLERTFQNSDFYYFAFEDSYDFRRYWIDYSAGIHSNIQFEDFLISGTVKYIRSVNYQWELKQLPGQSYFIPGKDVSNLHATINIAYIIK